MIDRMKYVSNDFVTVCYHYGSQSVHVINKRTSDSRTFGGWDGLYDLFKSFYDSMSEDLSYYDAVRYFTPTVGTTNISE